MNSSLCACMYVLYVHQLWIHWGCLAFFGLFPVVSPPLLRSYSRIYAFCVLERLLGVDLVVWPERARVKRSKQMFVTAEEHCPSLGDCFSHVFISYLYLPFRNLNSEIC